MTSDEAEALAMRIGRSARVAGAFQSLGAVYAASSADVTRAMARARGRLRGATNTVVLTQYQRRTLVRVYFAHVESFVYTVKQFALAAHDGGDLIFTPAELLALADED